MKNRKPFESTTSLESKSVLHYHSDIHNFQQGVELFWKLYIEYVSWCAHFSQRLISLHHVCLLPYN